MWCNTIYRVACRMPARCSSVTKSQLKRVLPSCQWPMHQCPLPMANAPTVMAKCVTSILSVIRHPASRVFVFMPVARKSQLTRVHMQKFCRAAKPLPNVIISPLPTASRSHLPHLAPNLSIHCVASPNRKNQFWQIALELHHTVWCCWHHVPSCIQ